MAFDFGLRDRRFQGEFRVECVKLEEIPVRLPRWRTRPTITFLLKVVDSLLRAGGKRCSFPCRLRQVVRISWQIEQHPMHPCAGGRIGIIHNQREALRGRRLISPVQLRRNIFIKTLKREEIYANRYEDLGHMRVNIQEFIEQYYNRLRLHSALGTVLRKNSKGSRESRQ
jgi:Integrase core domain